MHDVIDFAKAAMVPLTQREIQVATYAWTIEPPDDRAYNRISCRRRFLAGIGPSYSFQKTEGLKTGKIAVLPVRAHR